MTDWLEAETLLTVALIEAAIVAIGLGAVMVHACWQAWVAPRRRRRLDGARQLVLAALEGAKLDGGERDVIEGLPFRLQVRLFTDTASGVVGEGRARAVAMASDTGLVGVAARRCRSRRWWRRLRGARLLTMLGAGEGVMPALLDDPHGPVRSEAAYWGSTSPTPEVVARLVAMLGRGDFQTQFAVKDSLVRIGPMASEALAQRMREGDPEGMEACLEVAAGLRDAAFLSPALSLSADESESVRRRAANVLAAVGGEAAAARLTDMLRDPAPGVRAAASQALGRLGHWPAASAIFELTADSAWPVRQQAALALRALGGAGQLFLRRGSTDADPARAEIARHVLDLPESSAGALAS